MCAQMSPVLANSNQVLFNFPVLDRFIRIKGGYVVISRILHMSDICFIKIRPPYNQKAKYIFILGRKSGIDIPIF